MDDDANSETSADPDRVFAEMDDAAEIDESTADNDSGEAVQRAWEDSDALEGEAPSG